MSENHGMNQAKVAKVAAANKWARSLAGEGLFSLSEMKATVRFFKWDINAASHFLFTVRQMSVSVQAGLNALHRARKKGYQI